MKPAPNKGQRVRLRSIKDGQTEFQRGQQQVLEEHNAQPREAAIKQAAFEQFLGNFLLAENA